MNKKVMLVGLVFLVMFMMPICVSGGNLPFAPPDEEPSRPTTGFNPIASLIVFIILGIIVFGGMKFLSRFNENIVEEKDMFEQKQVQVKVFVICSYCGAKIEQGIFKCSNCGADM